MSEKNSEKIVVDADEWHSLQETLFLINQGVDRQIKERGNDKTVGFDEAWRQIKDK
ncbi:hypothetical protein [Levilactobacillus wangkuiensis]|uniref:hypothetical protein n=1 Tax=Levilactobacillus wangkuiensis TaxID=2799566 RepID=UPI0019439279|nr:hypothetical protein [Levilactobacillus wangkuiensis]